MMPAPYAMFFFGAPVLVVLMMVFTMGMAMERRRIRRSFHSDEDLVSAERVGYKNGLKHGYSRALYEQKQRPKCSHASAR